MLVWFHIQQKNLFQNCNNPEWHGIWLNTEPDLSYKWYLGLLISTDMSYRCVPSDEEDCMDAS